MTDERAGSGSSAGRTIAAFDFDGTLSRRDSLLPFLAFVCGAEATARAVAAEGARFGRVLLGAASRDEAKVALLRFGRVLLGAASRDEAKVALLTRLLSGEDARQMQESGKLFADRLVNRELRPAMRRRLEWHRRAGHRLVIVSASPTIYLETAGRLLGVDAVLATELEVDAEGRLTGRIAGRNCRGDEKASRLRAWLERSDAERSEQPPQLWAYGDSAGDAHMLALADMPVWVGWRSRIRRRRGAASRRER